MPSLDGARVAILVAHEFEDIELLYPIMRLSEAEASVVVDLAAAAYRAGKVVAAICRGPRVLISVDRRRGTDNVRGHRVTGYAAVEDDPCSAGGEYVDVPAVRVSNVVTGRCPDDLPEFCQEIAAAPSTA